MAKYDRAHEISNLSWPALLLQKTQRPCPGLAIEKSDPQVQESECVVLVSGPRRVGSCSVLSSIICEKTMHFTKPKFCLWMSGDWRAATSDSPQKQRLPYSKSMSTTS